MAAAVEIGERRDPDRIEACWNRLRAALVNPELRTAACPRTGVGCPPWRMATNGMELERIREAAERVAKSLGIEVVDVEWKVGRQRFLRVYIDKPVGVSHKDCEAVSNQLGVILDVEDLVPGPHYILEVSSPGLDRKLTKPAEFERFAGRLARISTTEPVENQKFFEGRLAGFADGKVRIEVKGRVIDLPMEGIRKANLVVEL